MPIALDPDEVYRYVIVTDRDKDNQPTLIFHYPTCRETRQVGNLFDAADTAKSVDEIIKLSCDALRIILVGWTGFKDRKGNEIPYEPSELDTVISDTDISELRAKLLKDMSASELEKKVLAFSALSSTADYATNVAEESASIRRQSSNRRSSNARPATAAMPAAKRAKAPVISR